MSIHMSKVPTIYGRLIHSTFFQSMMSFSFLNRKIPLPWDFAAYVWRENVLVSGQWKSKSQIKSLQLDSTKNKNKKLTGFMIQVLPGVLLNSSTKMWYSLGRVKVRGKKSHLAASERPASLSRFFRSRLRFFTVRFFRVSWKLVKTNKQKNNIKNNHMDLQSSELVTATLCLHGHGLLP